MYITTKQYLDLVKAKHEGTLRLELSKIIEPDMKKSEAELYLANLWLRSLHENSELIYDCTEHGESKIIPKIMLNKSDDSIYILDKIKIKLQQPPFFTDSTGEMIMKSIESVITENEEIPFHELTKGELDNLVAAITVDDIKAVKYKLDEEFIYMVYTDCCGETSTVRGFDKVMEII